MVSTTQFKTISKLIRAKISIFDIPFREIYNVQTLKLSVRCLFDMNVQIAKLNLKSNLLSIMKTNNFETYGSICLKTT